MSDGGPRRRARLALSSSEARTTATTPSRTSTPRCSARTEQPHRSTGSGAGLRSAFTASDGGGVSDSGCAVVLGPQAAALDLFWYPGRYRVPKVALY